jgi:hypothetical protein
MKSSIRLSSEVGIPLLKFIWQWKLVSSAALARRFFSHRKNPRTAYNYLCKLRKAHYLTSPTEEESRGQFWSLGRAGFEAIRHSFPELREEGYKSEFKRHDWLTSAFHLGEWLTVVPPGVQVFSEQELRRLEPEHYPAWVPRDSSHRPDGYWHRRDGDRSRTVALEMELSRKKASSYHGIGSFYGEAAQVGRVLWVVPALSDAVAIEANLYRGPGSSRRLHSFVILDSFLKHGWSANIQRGPGTDLSVESFLSKALELTPGASRVLSGCRGTAKALLETRIRRFDSVPYGHEATGRISLLAPTSVVAAPAPHETRLTVKPEVLL